MGARGHAMGVPGHKQFSVKAGQNEGECTFRIALARNSTFKGFDDSANLNTVEIPLKVQRPKK